MASPRDPDEVEQTLVPGAPPKPAPAGDTPAQPLSADATVNNPEPASDTLPPVVATPNEPMVVRVNRGPTGKLSIPIRVGPPADAVPEPHAPVSSDETQASGVAPAPKTSEATLPTGGTILSGSGFNGPNGSGATLPSFGNAGIPVEHVTPPADGDTLPPLPAPAVLPRPRGFVGASVPVRIVTPPAPPAPNDATLELPITIAPALDDSATLASGTQPARSEPADADATQVHRSGSGTLPEIDVDSNATQATPSGRTAVSGGVASGGISNGRSHDTAPIAPAAPNRAPNETGTMVGRFALRGLHASGGLGEVFTARDTELNREVAVKRIKSRYADDPGSRRRFLTEAELTAKLDHPGVVPVFGLVNDARGRPVYAMRFIRGETLKDEIDRYHGTGAKSPGSEKTEKTAGAEAKPSEPGAQAAPGTVTKEVPRTVAFRKLLSRFVYVCQAIAYAHEKGIIHRDIKPANVMVGGFGEVLVVDWGLAKSLSDGPDFDRIMRAQSEGGFRHDPEATDMPSHMTMAGTAVGTPSYMPPEQAAGELDKVGPRADVYSLGATLFAILTGRAPFVGKGPNETLELVRRGAFDPPVVVRADCPKPLSAICLKAMALRQEDRYATAQALAADVERWLSDEPVSAYQDPPLARLARWARRNPARVATGVSLLLAGVLAAGGIAWAVYVGEQKAIRERNEADKARRETDVAYAALGEEQKLTLQERDEVKRQKALVEQESERVTKARNLARERYKRAVATYNTLIRDLDKKLGDRENMQATRERLLLDATDGLKRLVEGKSEDEIGVDSTLVAAYRQMGEVYQIIGKTADAKVQFAKSVSMAEAVKNSADAPAGGRTPEARAAEMREADRDLARSLVGQAGVLAASDSTAALGAVDRALKLLEPLAATKPEPELLDELAAAKARRAAILMIRGQTRAALVDCEFAMETRRKLFEGSSLEPALTPNQKRDRERAFADSLDALAELQLRTGETAAAEKTAEIALGVRESVHKSSATPDVRRELAAGYARLGEVCFDRSRMTEAEKQYQKAVDVLKLLAADDKENVGARADLAAVYGWLGQVQLRTGELDKAVENARAGQIECAKLLDRDSDSAKAKRDLALAHERYGDALMARAREVRGLNVVAAKEGRAEYEAGFKLRQELQTLDTGSAAASIELARGHERVGDAKLATKDVDGALKEFAASEKLHRTAVKRDPDSASAARDLAVGLYKQAEANSTAGKSATANRLSSEATQLLVGLTRKNGASGQARRDLAVAYGKWGQVLAGDGKPTGALLVWQASLDRFQGIAQEDKGNKQAQEEVAEAWERLANYYISLNNAERALSAAREAARVWEKLWEDTTGRTRAGQRRLALARLRVGDMYTEVREFPKAEGAYRDAIRDVEQMKSDPLLAPVNALAHDKLLFLAAVRAGLNNPQNLRAKQYAEVRVTALRTIAALEIREGHAADAASAADELALVAKLPDDLFAVARTFAGCVAAESATESSRVIYAKRAVAALEAAVTEGFVNADALTTSEWTEVGVRVPNEFAKAKAKLMERRGTE